MCEPDLGVKSDKHERNELKVAAQENVTLKRGTNQNKNNKLHDFLIRAFCRPLSRTTHPGQEGLGPTTAIGCHCV